MDCLFLSWPLVIDEDVCLMKRNFQCFLFSNEIFCQHFVGMFVWEVGCGVYYSIYDRFDFNDWYLSVIWWKGAWNFEIQLLVFGYLDYFSGRPLLTPTKHCWRPEAFPGDRLPKRLTISYLHMLLFRVPNLLFFASVSYGIIRKLGRARGMSSLTSRWTRCLWWEIHGFWLWYHWTSHLMVHHCIFSISSHHQSSLGLVRFIQIYQITCLTLGSSLPFVSCLAHMIEISPWVWPCSFS